MWYYFFTENFNFNPIELLLDPWDCEDFYMEANLKKSKPFWGLDGSTLGFIRIPVKVQGSYTQDGFFGEIEIEKDGESWKAVEVI